MLQAKLRPIEDRLAEREEQAERMRAQMQQAMEAMGGVRTATRASVGTHSPPALTPLFVSPVHQLCHVSGCARPCV